jgi:site-specific DNA-methyltransferase (adenine-specific)
MINLNLGCSLEAMRSMPDNSYKLAIVDPPYGIGAKRLQNGGGFMNDRALLKFSCDFDDHPPPPEYFEELRRVSENQIIWGGNYFVLPPTRGIICWDKCQPWETYSQVELAWTSYDKPAALVKIDTRYSGKIHPTQKPVALYHWLLGRYASKGDRILDTHFGIGLHCHCVPRYGYGVGCLGDRSRIPRQSGGPFGQTPAAIKIILKKII